MGYPGSSGGINYLVGFKEVIRKLNVEINQLPEKSIKGMIKAAALIRYETEHTPPKTPVDLGNLRASWFVVTAKSNPVGSSPTFVGKDASQFGMDHGKAITEQQGIARVQSAKGSEVLIMGYSANYAGFVHEMIGDIEWTREDSGAKWLEEQIKMNEDRILELIATEVKIKK